MLLSAMAWWHRCSRGLGGSQAHSWHGSCGPRWEEHKTAAHSCPWFTSPEKHKSGWLRLTAAAPLHCDNRLPYRPGAGGWPQALALQVTRSAPCNKRPHTDLSPSMGTRLLGLFGGVWGTGRVGCGLGTRSVSYSYSQWLAPSSQHSSSSLWNQSWISRRALSTESLP